MQAFVITLLPNASLDALWESLSSQGAEFLFSEEDEFIEKIYLRCDPAILKHPSILAVTPYEIPDIDWAAQWEGKEALSLVSYGFADKTIHMAPGSGFGDLSHPTTRIVCELMSGAIQKKKVLDVGSGSGILSFAAAAMGASEVIGIEIDPAAIDHANANAILNGMNIRFHLPHDMPVFYPEVVLLNMIFMEQQQALKSLNLKGSFLIITSGILAEQKKSYLEWAASEGWDLQQILQEECWLGFSFKTTKKANV